jgi:hypothetical protein
MKTSLTTGGLVLAWLGATEGSCEVSDGNRRRRPLGVTLAASVLIIPLDLFA